MGHQVIGIATGEQGTLGSSLQAGEFAAYAWVMLTKKAISKVDRIILFCFVFLKSKASLLGRFASNIFDAKPKT